ncbi:AMP-binding protein [Nocardia bovistercoris]|uniref:AMP-binding protein n=1 Tax=Nocardia bovistercoris TaxID=2785916 RepID=A0A931IF72_9NOCA|nr:AMP-binding protein [Nocardia bovistercoris]MBH0779265.1 AMP-binding protein [Nocardia bovistercoris]
MTDETTPLPGGSGRGARRPARSRRTAEAATPSLHAIDTPERVAIMMATSGETVTYTDLEDRSARFAGALRARGISAGGQIAILMENNRAYLEVAWAAQRSGLYYTAVNNHLRVGEVQYILDDCGAQAIVTSSATAEIVAGLDLSRIPVRVCVAGDVDGFERYADLLAEHRRIEVEDEREGREMLYSSGTTGRPKGVRKPLPGTEFGHPSAAPVQIANGLLTQWESESVVFLSPAPLYHGAPLIFSMSLHRFGATVIVMERFDARQCLALIERHRVTHTQMVPTMFVRLLRLPRELRERHDLSSLVDIVHSAAPCAIPVKRAMIEWLGPIVNEYYSGTEDIGSTYITSKEWLAHPGSVGRPTQDCFIVGEDGEILPSGQVGSIYFGGGRPFEYHNDPKKTASVAHHRHRDRRTFGDIGYLDDDGYLYLTDRQAHMIISGGVNIYPQEVEDVLATHPAVLDAAVIGVPDGEMGESVRAVVQPTDRSAAEDTAAELIAYCRARLASYKCPRAVDFVDELPRDPSGKLFKRHLHEKYWAGRSFID